MDTGHSVEVIAYVDEDDPDLRAYTAPCARTTHVMVGPRVGTAKALKKLLEAVETDWVMIGSDDIFFETKEWDQKLIEVIPQDKIGSSYSSDDLGDNFNHFVFHRKMFELTGLWPDVFWHLGPDGYLGRVLEELKRKFFVKSVMIKHLHPKYGKGTLDKTFQESRTMGGHPKDEMEQAMKFYERDLGILRSAIDDARLLAG